MADRTLDERLEEIRDARKRRMDWVLLAQKVEEIAESDEWPRRHGSRSASWDELSDITGYSANTLHRMGTTIRWITEIEKRHQKELPDRLGIPRWEPGCLLKRLEYFPKAELFYRIHKRDPEEALNLAARMGLGTVGVKTMQEILTDLINRDPTVPKFVTPTRPRPAPHARLTALDEQKLVIYGSEPATLYFGRYRFTHVVVDAVGLSWERTGGIRFVDGFVVLSGPAPKRIHNVPDQLSQIDYKASFFRHVWLFFPEPDNWPVVEIARNLDELGIMNVGIVRLDASSRLVVDRSPKSRELPPRYDTVVEQIIRQGIPDFRVQ